MRSWLIRGPLGCCSSSDALLVPEKNWDEMQLSPRQRFFRKQAGSQRPRDHRLLYCYRRCQSADWKLVTIQLINDFARRYRKEFDFCDQAARLALQIIAQNVRRAGIRAIVTSRAKSPIRLGEKVRQRHLVKKYEKTDDISREGLMHERPDHPDLVYETGTHV